MITFDYEIPYFRKKERKIFGDTYRLIFWIELFLRA